MNASLLNTAFYFIAKIGFNSQCFEQLPLTFKDKIWHTCLCIILLIHFNNSSCRVFNRLNINIKCHQLLLKSEWFYQCTWVVEAHDGVGPNMIVNVFIDFMKLNTNRLITLCRYVAPDVPNHWCWLDIDFQNLMLQLK